MSFTPVEAEQIHAGTMSALVAITDTKSSGVLAFWKEGKAGQRVLGALPEPLRTAVLGSDKEPEGYEPPAEPSMEAELQLAVDVVAAREPQLLETYKGAVLEAVVAAADAAKGISAEEQQVIDRVKAVLG